MKFDLLPHDVVSDPPPGDVILPHAWYCVCLAVGANEDCLWYVDKNGTWHNGFDCPLITFCCGNCHRRYCCLDAFKMITEREQKRCMLFQFRWAKQQQGFWFNDLFIHSFDTGRRSLCSRSSAIAAASHFLPFLEADRFFKNPVRGYVWPVCTIRCVLKHL